MAEEKKEKKQKKFYLNDENAEFLEKQKNQSEYVDYLITQDRKKREEKLTEYTQYRVPEANLKHHVCPPNCIGLYCVNDHNAPEEKFLMEGRIELIQPGNIMDFHDLTCPKCGDLTCECGEELHWNRRLEYYCPECMTAADYIKLYPNLVDEVQDQ
jgi:hypothetical protein